MTLSMKVREFLRLLGQGGNSFHISYSYHLTLLLTSVTNQTTIAPSYSLAYLITPSFTFQLTSPFLYLTTLLLPFLLPTSHLSCLHLTILSLSFLISDSPLLTQPLLPSTSNLTKSFFMPFVNTQCTSNLILI